MGPQLLAELSLRHVMVQVVMRVVVGQVAEDESGEGREGLRRPEDEHVQAEKDGRERDADRRGHDQPHRVVRVVMVDAVDDEVETVAAGEPRLPVEDQAVEPVLGHGPDGDPGREEQRDRPEPRDRDRFRARRRR